jgi:hypothetical protein
MCPVIEISVSMETAAKYAVELRYSYSEAPVYKLHVRRKPQPPQKKQNPPKCYRCDGQGLASFAFLLTLYIIIYIP